MALLVCLKEEITKKQPQMKKKKVLFHQDNAPCHKSIATMAKLHELHFRLLLYPPYSPDLAPSNYWLWWQTSKERSRERDLAPIKKWYWKLRRILRTRTDHSTKEYIELLEKHWNQCITLEGDYIDEYSQIFPKSCCLIS